MVPYKFLRLISQFIEILTATRCAVFCFPSLPMDTMLQTLMGPRALRSGDYVRPLLIKNIKDIWPLQNPELRLIWSKHKILR